jgi:two-component system nitrogen regulation sensor histidine kinase GlnL
MQNDLPDTALRLSGLELLSSAVVLVDDQLVVRYLNPGAENLFARAAARSSAIPAAPAR